MADRTVSLNLQVLDQATSPVAHIGAAINRLTDQFDKLADAVATAQEKLSSLHSGKISGPGGEAPVTQQGGGGFLGGLRSSISYIAGPVTRALEILRTLTAGLTNAFGAVTRAVGAVVSAMTSLVGVAGRMAVVVGGAGAGALAFLGLKAATAGASIETMYQKLLTALKTPAAAQGMMDWARWFADVTPFETGEVIESTARLANYGLEATHWLPMIGNMAASMGKSVVDGVEAIADAISGGGLERLKEFGISSMMLLKAGAEKSAGGVSYGSEQAIEALKGALQSIMQSRFGGAMERMATTLAGKWSTFVGALQNMAATIGGALMPVLKPMLDYMTQFTDLLRGRLAPIVERMQPLFVALGESMLAGLPGLLDRIPALLENVVAGIPTIIPKIQEFATKAWAIFGWLFDSLSRVSGPAIAGVLDAVIGAANGVMWFIGQLTTSGSSINTFVSTIIQSLQSLAQTVATSIAPVFAQLADPSSLLSAELNKITESLQVLSATFNDLMTRVLTPQNVATLMELVNMLVQAGSAIAYVTGGFNEAMHILTETPGQRHLRKTVENGGGTPAERRAYNALDQQFTGGRNQVEITVKGGPEHSASVTRDQRKALQRAGIIPTY